MKKLIYILALVAVLFTSCRPTKEIVYRDVFRDRVQIDTVENTVHDSIRITHRGDTVKIEKYKTIYKNRVTIRRDTVSNTQRETRTITRTVKTPPVVRKVQVWGFLDWVGLIFSAWIILFTIIKIKKQFTSWQQQTKDSLS
jgi:hypothetical protein